MNRLFESARSAADSREVQACGAPRQESGLRRALGALTGVGDGAARRLAVRALLGVSLAAAGSADAQNAAPAASPAATALAAAAPAVTPPTSAMPAGAAAAPGTTPAEGVAATPPAVGEVAPPDAPPAPDTRGLDQEVQGLK